MEPLPSTPTPAPRSAVPAWVWPVVLVGLIFVASGRSAIAGPDIVNFDKVVHLLVFGLLATLIARIEGIARWPLLGVGWAAVLASLYGAADEWRQSLTPGRYVEFADWVADTIGAILATWLYARWAWYRSLLERPILFRKARVESLPTGVAESSRTP